MIIRRYRIMGGSARDEPGWLSPRMRDDTLPTLRTLTAKAGAFGGNACG